MVVVEVIVMMCGTGKFDINLSMGYRVMRVMMGLSMMIARFAAVALLTETAWGRFGLSEEQGCHQRHLALWIASHFL